MRTLSLKRELKMFLGYLLAYSLILTPIFIGVMGSQAITAEANFFMKTFVQEPKEALLTFFTGETQSATNPAPHLQVATEPETNTLNPTHPLPANPFPEKKASLLIPSIEVSAPIIFSQSSDNTAMQKDLENGVAHFPESARFNEPGTAILLGHTAVRSLTRNPYHLIFNYLIQLSEGDQFYIFYQNKIYTYEVTDKKIISPEQFQVKNSSNSSYLILMGCWPIGQNQQRIVISSRLISTNQTHQTN